MTIRKQQEPLSNEQKIEVLDYLKTRRYPARNKLIFLLSMTGGLRATEMSELTWDTVIDSNNEVGDFLNIKEKIKDSNLGRIIPINEELKNALIDYRKKLSEKFYIKWNITDCIIRTERSKKTSPQTIINFFQRLYKSLGYKNCSFMSGRRSFLIEQSAKISNYSGSYRTRKNSFELDVESWERFNGLTGDETRLLLKAVYHFAETGETLKMVNKMSSRLKQFKDDITNQNLLAQVECDDINEIIASSITKQLRTGCDGDKYFNMLGYTIDELKTRLESQFTDGMTWENRGHKGWHIDHIKPKSWFDCSIRKEFIECWSLSNLQPLWAFDNLSKSNKYIGKLNKQST